MPRPWRYGCSGRIAKDIARPLSAARRWLRSVRGAHTQRRHTQGVAWIHRVEGEVFATITPPIPCSATC